MIFLYHFTIILYLILKYIFTYRLLLVQYIYIVLRNFFWEINHFVTLSPTDTISFEKLKICLFDETKVYLYEL